MTGTYIEFGQLQAANFQAQSAKDLAHESARATGNVRINEKDRIVFRIVDNKLEIMACKGHYEA